MEYKQVYSNRQNMAGSGSILDRLAGKWKRRYNKEFGQAPQLEAARRESSDEGSVRMHSFDAAFRYCWEKAQTAQNINLTEGELS